MAQTDFNALTSMKVGESIMESNYSEGGIRFNITRVMNGWIYIPHKYNPNGDDFALPGIFIPKQ